MSACSSSTHTSSFHAQTEERTGLPPAPGGIPDLGYRLYTTAYTSDFQPAPVGVELQFPRHRPRYGMLSKSTWNEASYSFGGGPGGLLAAARGAGAALKAFDTTHGGREMSKAEIAAQFQTTAREAAEGGVFVSSQAMAVAAKTSATLARSIHAMPAGGAPSVTITDGGKRITGVSGEIVRESADARYDSRAQRAWTGVPDVGLLHGMGKAVRVDLKHSRACARSARAPALFSPPPTHARSS